MAKGSMNEGIINVVIPTFNRSRYLKAAIDSVLKQSYENFRIFIFDNASLDDTAAVVKAYKDCRINLLCSEVNMGMHKNWKRALTHFEDGIVALLEDDNLWEPTHLQDAIVALKQFPEASFYFCCARMFNVEGGLSNSYLKPYWLTCCSSTMFDVTRDGLNEFIFRTPFSASSLIAKASALNQIDYESGSNIWCMDLLWWTDMVIKNNRYIYNPNCNVLYRVHDGSMTRLYSSNPKTSIQTREVLRQNYTKAKAHGFICEDTIKRSIIELSDFYGAIFILSVLSRKASKDVRDHYFLFYKRNRRSFACSKIRAMRWLSYVEVNIAYFLDDFDFLRSIFARRT